MGKHVVVIGGGVAGLESAGRLSMAGFDVSLLEKENKTGGHLNEWHKLFPDRRDSGEVKEYFEGITKSDSIKFMNNTTIEKLHRNKGHFSMVTSDG